MTRVTSFVTALRRKEGARCARFLAETKEAASTSMLWVQPDATITYSCNCTAYCTSLSRGKSVQTLIFFHRRRSYVVSYS